MTRSENGYTLIELLLYMTMTALLMAGLMAFFAMTLSVRVKNESISEVDQQGQFALSTMLQAVRNAEAVTSPVTASSDASLALATVASGTNPTIFSVSGTNLQMKEGTGTAIPLTSNKVAVTNLLFRNLSRQSTTGSIEVSFTMSAVNVAGRNDYDYQKTFTGAASLR